MYTDKMKHYLTTVQLSTWLVVGRFAAKKLGHDGC